MTVGNGKSIWVNWNWDQGFEGSLMADANFEFQRNGLGGKLELGVRVLKFR